MSLDKEGLKLALQTAFEDIEIGKTAADAADALANAIDTYVKTAIATVVIPPGTVVIAAAPIASPVLNPTPISLSGAPDSIPPGGLS